MDMQAAVSNARRQMDRLRIALASPSPREIEDTLPELERAIAAMKELAGALAGGGADNEILGYELAALAREVGVVRKLADHSLELCNSWAVLLATAAGGYVASAKPAPRMPPSDAAPTNEGGD